MAELRYNDAIARRFAIATLVWGALAMAAGIALALQLLVWQANLPPYLSFGRLRPVHTTLAVFAFVGNMVFAGVYHSSQRVLRVRLPSPALAAVHFWGWQLVIAASLVTLPLGHSQGKELAELEWPIDAALALVWIAFAAQVFWMVRRRQEPRLYVSVWFTIATIVAFGAAHLVNALAVPIGALASVPLFGGLDDALVQAWYADSGVGVFTTLPVLGIMYYLVPLAAGRPLYSYRLAILHFWGLVLLIGWSAPRHLVNTSAPDWLQVLGVIFTLALWAPSWAGVANGLLTLRGAPAERRGDPVLLFAIGALLFHGLVTAEAPLLAARSVAGLAAYTDWPIGHAHAAGMGWNGFMAAALLYYLVPRLWGTELRSRAAAGAHFYMATVGVLTYLFAMWIAGATQGVMLRAGDAGGAVTYGFLETSAALRVTYWARLVGGALYLGGFLLMVWNLAMTIRAGRATDGAEETTGATALPFVCFRRLVLAPPLASAAVVLALCAAATVMNPIAALVALFVAAFVAVAGLAAATVLRPAQRAPWHERLEGHARAFTGLVLIASLIGPLAEQLPALRAERAPNPRRPASALELAGRAIYLREGCQACHSQMVRPFLWEVARYGQVSSPEDSSREHPFIGGTRRIGPDLAHAGTRRDHLWNYRHLVDPRAVSPGSTMPPYHHLTLEAVDLGASAGWMRALRGAGVPYRDRDVDAARPAGLAQGQLITAELARAGQPGVAPDSAMVALLAYLHSLRRLPEVKP